MRFSTGIICGAVGLALLVPSTARGEGGRPADLTEADQHNRVLLGLPPTTNTRDGNVQGIPFSKSEMEMLGRYTRAVEENYPRQKEIENHPNILNVFLNPEIAEPTITLTVDPGSSEKIRVFAEQVIRKLKVQIIEAPVTRSERDFLWNQVRAEVVVRDQEISGRFPELGPYPKEPTFPVTDALARANLKVVSAKLGGEDWRVQVAVVDQKSDTKGDLAERAAQVMSSLSETSVRGELLWTVSEGTKPISTQAPERPSADDMARGGKRMSIGCTSGPSVTSGYSTEALMTAGHCMMRRDPNDPNQILPGTENSGSQIANPLAVTVGNVNGQITIACHKCVPAPSAPPWNINYNSPPQWFWGQGVDFALMFYGGPAGNPTQNGAGRHYFLSQDVNGNRSYVWQNGSADPFNGQQMVCVEGASILRPDGYWMHSSCGTAGGVQSDEFRTVVYYWGNPICAGDSGAVTNIPIYNPVGGQQTGAWVTGVISARSGASQAPFGGTNCSMSGPNGNAIGYISSFWKIHNYFIHYRQGTTPPWVLTW